MNRVQYFFICALGLVCVQLAFATPYLNLGLIKAPAWLQITIALTSCVVFAIGSIWVARFLSERSFTPVRFIERMAARDWILLTIVVGCAIRIFWNTTFPTVPGSDGATYVALGQRLSQGEAYLTAGTYAYWPPGYPFLLSAVFFIAGHSQTAMLVFNLFCYAMTIWVVFLLAQHVLDTFSAKIATALLAIWPNHFMAANIEMKEYALLPILVGAIWLYLTATQPECRNKILRLIFTGLSLGYAILIQPSSMLFVSVIIFYALTRKELRSRLLTDLVLIIVGMAVVITPWTIRNYSVFGKVVLTTGGGSVLYRANNPLATGGYTNRGEVSLAGLDELAANKKGRELAIKWITENPKEFLKLALIKQIRFLGDDSSGAHATLKERAPAIAFVSVKAISNLFWLLVWACILVSVILALRRPNVYKPEIVLVALCFLYFYGIHSVFKRNGKYHFQTIGFIAILASSLFYKSVGRTSVQLKAGSS